ncbi:Rop guanine nucleotide exchange factor 1 [Tanacetum coccineum]
MRRFDSRSQTIEIDMMKERFAKLLLGLESLALQNIMWQREMDWLLLVSDSFVEVVPVQKFPDGGTYKVMVPHPRSNLHMNPSVLKKLDAMLISMLDRFRDMEFCYVD